MNDLEHHIADIARKVVMTSAEKAQMRWALLSHMEKSKSVPRMSPFMQFFASHPYRHTASFAFISVLFFTGGLSAVANKALPGGILYPVKLGVNEKVLSWFAVSPQSKKQFQVTLAERRLIEAEMIAQDPSVPLAIKENHAKKVDAQIKVLEVSAEELQPLSTETEFPQVSTVAVTAPALDEAAITETPNDGVTVKTIMEAENPTALMAKAAFNGNPISSGAVEIANLTTPSQTLILPVTSGDIAALRVKLGELKKALNSETEARGAGNDTVRFETKLLRAQKTLLTINATSTPDVVKQKGVNDVKEVFSDVEVFLKKNTEESIKGSVQQVKPHEDKEKQSERPKEEKIISIPSVESLKKSINQ